MELKPCPFCGSKAELYGDCEMVKARCTNPECWCHLVSWFDEPEEAAEEWNRRTPPAEENEPLTLDDLKEMDGQPVWAEEPDGYKSYSRWVLVDTAWKAKGLVYLHSWPGADTFQAFTVRGGKIYRRPLAEG